MSKKVIGKKFSQSYGEGGGESGGVIFKGSITIPSDFPTLAEVQPGWEYITDNPAGVTDNDPTKTNTGKHIPDKTFILWTGSTWAVEGGESVVLDNGVNIEPVNVRGFNIPLGQTYNIGGNPIPSTPYVEPQQSKIFYISPTGLDTNHGKNIENAFLTPYKGCAAAGSLPLSTENCSVVNFSGGNYIDATPTITIYSNTVLDTRYCSYTTATKKHFIMSGAILYAESIFNSSSFSAFEIIGNDFDFARIKLEKYLANTSNLGGAGNATINVPDNKYLYLKAMFAGSSDFSDEIIRVGENCLVFLEIDYVQNCVITIGNNSKVILTAKETNNITWNLLGVGSSYKVKYPISQNAYDAIINANNPTATNYFATLADISSATISQQTNIFYLAPTGADTNSGKNIEKPFLTPVKACFQAGNDYPAGCTIFNFSYTNYDDTQAIFIIKSNTIFNAYGCNFSTVTKSHNIADTATLIANKIIPKGNLPVFSTVTGMGGAMSTPAKIKVETIGEFDPSALNGAIKVNNGHKLDLFSSNINAPTANIKFLDIGNGCNVYIRSNIIKGKISAGSNSIVTIECHDISNLIVEPLDETTVFKFIEPITQNIYDGLNGNKSIPSLANYFLTKNFYSELNKSCPYNYTNFYYWSQDIVAGGDGNTQNANAIRTLTKNAPLAGLDKLETAIVNNNTKFLAAFRNTDYLSLEKIPFGLWKAEHYLNVDNIQTGANVYIRKNIMIAHDYGLYKGSVTGSGTSRQFATIGVSPFLPSDEALDFTTSGWLETPQGFFPINHFNNSGSVDITTLSTYVNETNVSFIIWRIKFYINSNNIIESLETKKTFEKYSHEINIESFDYLGTILFAIAEGTANDVEVGFSHSARAGNEPRNPSHFISPIAMLTFDQLDALYNTPNLPNADNPYTTQLDLLAYTNPQQSNIYYFLSTGNDTANSGKNIEKPFLTPVKACSEAYINYPNECSVINPTSIYYIDSSFGSFTVHTNTTLMSVGCSYQTATKTHYIEDTAVLYAKTISATATFPALTIKAGSGGVNSRPARINVNAVRAELGATVGTIAVLANQKLDLDSPVIYAAVPTARIISFGTNTIGYIKANIIIGEIFADAGSIVYVTCQNRSGLITSGTGTFIFGATVNDVFWDRIQKSGIMVITPKTGDDSIYLPAGNLALDTGGLKQEGADYSEINKIADINNKVIVAPNKTIRGSINDCYTAYSNYSETKLWFDSSIQIPSNNQNAYDLLTLTTRRSDDAIISEKLTVVNNSSSLLKIFDYPSTLYNPALDSIGWSFEYNTKVNIPQTNYSNTLIFAIKNRKYIGYVSVTGTGTSRTLTCTSPYFIDSDFDADKILTAWIKTPTAILKVIGHTAGNQTTFTVETQSTYINETLVLADIYRHIFLAESENILNTDWQRGVLTPNKMIAPSATQLTYTIDDSIAIFVFAKSTASVNTEIWLSYGGIGRQSNACTPIITYQQINYAIEVNADSVYLGVPCKTINDNTNADIVFNIPKCYKILDVYAICTFTASGTGKDIDLTSTYRDSENEGAPMTKYTETDTTSTYSYSANLEKHFLLYKVLSTAIAGCSQRGYTGGINIKLNNLGGATAMKVYKVVVKCLIPFKAY